MTTSKPNFNEIATEVKSLHDRDAELSTQLSRNKVQQRDIRLKIGGLVTGVPEHLRTELADRSGYTVARLKNFERCRLAWPEGTFPSDVGYTALEELAPDEDRFAKIQGGMSKRDAREARGGKKSDTPSRWTPAEKASVMREFVADPEVARQVASDPEIRGLLAHAENESYRERRDQRDQDPSNKAMRQTVSGDDVYRGIVRARYQINRALDQAMEDGLTDEKRQLCKQGVADLRVSITWLESFLNSGDTSFEQALSDLLGQEN